MCAGKSGVNATGPEYSQKRSSTEIHAQASLRTATVFGLLTYLDLEILPDRD